MLTKGQNSKFRAVKYVAMVLALVAVLAFCFTSCGKGEVLSAEYLAGTLDKDQYQAGETFDCTGAQMKVTYANGDVETVNVTKEMVGEQVLSFGMSYVEVTYSATVKCTLPVTVIDPYSNEKTQAIAAINAKDDVKNGDKGVDALVAAYVNKINAATDKAGIDAQVAAFDTALKAYVDGKAAALKKVENADLKGLYEQFLLDVQNAQTLAITNIKAALSVDEADELAAAFEETIAKKLAEQTFYEGDKNNNGAGGQIAQKVEMITLIGKHIDKAENLIALIEENGLTDALTEKVNGYKDAIAKLELLKEKVRLAINLEDCETELAAITPTLATSVDKIYDMIKDGHTVLPAPYKADGTLETELEKDPTAKLLYDAETLLNAAVTEFGGDDVANTDNARNLVLDLIQSYQYGDLPSEKFDLLALLNDIYDKREDLDAKQAELSVQNAAVAAWGENNVPTVAEIRAAWAALKLYGADTTIEGSEAVLFTTKAYTGDGATTKGMFSAFELVYVTSETEEGKAYEGIYKVNKWSGYYVTKEDVVKYYFPALEALIDATADAAEKADEVVKLVSDIGPVVLTHGELDAAKRIAAAKTALEAFEKYAPTLNDQDDALSVAYTQAKATYDAAVERYGDLEAARDALINEIKALGKPENIVIADYATDGKLYKARASWFAFRTLNSYIPEGKEVPAYFTDVIDDADLSKEGDEYTAQLLACMKKYAELKFIEEIKVYAAYTISDRYVTAMENTEATKDQYNTFRSDLTAKQTELLKQLPEFNASKYAEATLENIMTISNNDVEASETVVKSLANQFVDYYNTYVETNETGHKLLDQLQ